MIGVADKVQVRNLRVVASAADGSQEAIVRDVSFSIPSGEVLALIGESGSGKTTIALSLLRYARRGCRIESGEIRLGDSDIMAMGASELRSLRGRRVSYVAQSAASAFNPSMKIMDQILEATRIHRTLPPREAEARAAELFHALSLPEPDSIGFRYPHQVSGGQLQRLMAAMALITDPELVIFDEPTTALDVTTQIDVLRAFKRVVRERDITTVYVSHDLAVVAQIADRVVVLNQGEVREIGPTAQLLTRPQDPYTRELLAAARPALRTAGEGAVGEQAVLSVQGLTAGYGRPGRDGSPGVTILESIDFSIPRGTSLGVIGESGSGKSTLARAVAGLVPPAAGTIVLGGDPLPGEMAARSRDQLRRIQIVFQNADTALNPAHTVERILARPLAFYRGTNGAEQTSRLRELLDLVHLPASIASQPCARLSGGQKQRVNLARALAAEPDLILCDEVTSALDTVVATAILDLLMELQRELQVSYMFISHDISVVRAICNDVLVLYAGRVVEYGSREAFCAAPAHPYTKLLINSVPALEQGWLERSGQHSQSRPADGAMPGLCPFFDRCPVAIPGQCDTGVPPWHALPAGNRVLCHHYSDCPAG